MTFAASSDGPALGASRVGAELRAARERLGWALPDVVARLRIRMSFMEAIEDGRVADLPGSTYAVGFVRNYATLLGLNAAEVSRRFRAEAHEVNRKTELAFPAPAPQRGVPAMAVVLLGAVIAAGAYAAWYRSSGDARTAVEAVPVMPERLAPLADRAPPSNLSPQIASILPPSPPPPGGVAPVAAAPVAAAPPPAPAAAAASAIVPAASAALDQARVILRFKADTWIQVRGQGQVLLNRIMRGGETWPVPRGMQVKLTTGNAGSTEVLVDGVPDPALGPPGAVRRDVAVDGDATKSGAIGSIAPQQSQ